MELSERLKAEPHKHKMEIVTTEKVPLYDVKTIGGRRNELLRGYDTFTFKSCQCGFKQPINVARKLNGDS